VLPNKRIEQNARSYNRPEARARLLMPNTLGAGLNGSCCDSTGRGLGSLPSPLREYSSGVVVMKRATVWMKVIAIVGAIIASVPPLAPLVFTRWGALGTGHFNFDWLMPAELFPLAFLGGSMLLAVALSVRSHRALLGWGLGIAAGSLAAGLGFAQVSGLASGAIQPEGPAMWFLVAMLAVYTAAAAEMSVAGILLSRDLVGHRDEQAPPAVSGP
jgi:hypothetical protein